jgi:hypothetical protein
MARKFEQSFNEGKQMTVMEISVQAQVSGAGAPSHVELVWLRADWRHIAKATQEGRWGKVKAL